MTRFAQAFARGTIVLLAVAAPAGAADQATSVTAAGITLRSVSVSLPSEDQTLPGGASAELVSRTCTPCHSPAMILTQPALSKSVWLEEVNKMRNTYKAPFPAEDVPDLVAYLVEHKGTK